MDKVVVGLVEILHTMQDPIKNFKKDTYEEIFREFEAVHGDTIKELDAVILASGDREKKMQEIAEGFVYEIEKELDAFPKKRTRQNKLSDYNMALVTCYFPAVLDLNQNTGKNFLERFLAIWKQHFPAANLKLAAFEEINAGFQKRYCYITTAVCESLGKPDECYELNLLRDYRDDYLSRQENGEELIRLYYDIAPTIVKRINRKPDSHEIYYDIWKTYLMPCIRFIEKGENEACRQLYTDMVYDLQNKYFS